MVSFQEHHQDLEVFFATSRHLLLKKLSSSPTLEAIVNVSLPLSTSYNLASSGLHIVEVGRRGIRQRRLSIAFLLLRT